MPTGTSWPGGAKCRNKTKRPPREFPMSRGAVRKRCREKGDFAVSRRQSALTTTKGACGAFPCATIKIAHFLVRGSSAPGFWMKKAQRAAPQALVAWGVALRVLCAKILRQNRRFLMPPRLFPGALFRPQLSPPRACRRGCAGYFYFLQYPIDI